MDKILHDPKDPKLWELWYIPYYGSCRILSINRMGVAVVCRSTLEKVFKLLPRNEFQSGRSLEFIEHKEPTRRKIPFAFFQSFLGSCKLGLVLNTGTGRRHQAYPLSPTPPTNPEPIEACTESLKAFGAYYSF